MPSTHTASQRESRGFIYLDASPLPHLGAPGNCCVDTLCYNIRRGPVKQRWAWKTNLSESEGVRRPYRTGEHCQRPSLVGCS